MNEGVDVTLAGGLDSISLVQNDHWNSHRYKDPNVSDRFYSSMLESQKRTANAQAIGRFDAEIIPVEAMQLFTDKASGEVTEQSIRLEKDECNRPQTTFEGLQALKPVLGGATSTTASNASQLSNGASVCVVMEATEAAQRNLAHLAPIRRMAVAGCAPEEMRIGPIVAIPRLLNRHGLAVVDIGLWEINEAFDSQTIILPRSFSIPSDQLNLNGRSISIGHPYGMSGAGMAGHALIEGARRGREIRGSQYVCRRGQGAAALFEVGG